MSAYGQKLLDQSYKQRHIPIVHNLATVELDFVVKNWYHLSTRHSSNFKSKLISAVKGGGIGKISGP